MERTLMTGITIVSSQSMFSDFNNVEEVTVTSREYETSFGFTEEEVFKALEENGLGSEKNNVKEWYDGFTFGKQTDIYNPWSITQFLRKGEYETYWSNTGSNALINKLIREGNYGIKRSMEQLIKGKTVICPINKRIVYADLDKGGEAIWSLLVASGYLKIISYEQISITQKRPNYELALTNGEVRLMFEEMISRWFAEEGDNYNQFITAMLSDNLGDMNLYMQKITAQVFSYFDTSKGPLGDEPERFYHGFVLGLLVELKGRYNITSNRESGFGRYDVMLEPVDKEKDAAIIIEFKVLNSEKSLEDTVQTALTQIEEKQYETVLIDKGFPKKNIRKYGFAFEGKKVLIGSSKSTL